MKFFPVEMLCTNDEMSQYKHLTGIYVSNGMSDRSRVRSHTYNDVSDEDVCFDHCYALFARCCGVFRYQLLIKTCSCDWY